MHRITCVNLPEFPLQLLLRRHPDWARLPAVVVERDAPQGEILWANEHARRFRILPGMRYAAGLALSSELRAGVVAPGEVDDAVAEATAALRFYSAGVEPSTDEPGVFWLDASGLTLLYPSLRKWAALIHADLERLRFTASVVVGFSRFGCYAVAKMTAVGSRAKQEWVFDTPETEREATRRVPINRLGVAAKLRNALFKLGITTVGGFLDLPANGVKKRFGGDVHRLYQLARDELFAPLEPQAPQIPLSASVHIDSPEANMERLAAIIERELQSLVMRLSQRSEVLSAIVLRLGFDDDRHVTERLQPARPTLELGEILELVRLRLTSVLSAADGGNGNGGARRYHNGVVDVEVEVVGTPALRRQGELFVERSPRDLDAAARAFARLRAEMGDGAVVRAVLREGHLPEARYTWEAMTAVATPRARVVRHPPLVRRVYDRPVVFSPGRQRHADRMLTSHIDDGSVIDTVGPFVISGGWWNREVQREYYYVRTANGRALWMYYDRRRQCWFLHGEVE